VLVFLNGVWLALGTAWYGYTLWCLFRLGTKRSNHWFMTWPAQFSILACLSAYLLAIAEDGLGGVLAFSITVFLPPIAVFLIFIPFVGQFVLPLFLFVFPPLAFWPATRRIPFAITLLACQTVQVDNLTRSRIRTARFGIGAMVRNDLCATEGTSPHGPTCRDLNP